MIYPLYFRYISREIYSISWADGRRKPKLQHKTCLLRMGSFTSSINQFGFLISLTWIDPWYSENNLKQTWYTANSRRLRQQLCSDILQKTCYQQVGIRMRSHGLRQLNIDNRSVASCQQNCCKLIVKTCYPQACCKLFQQVVYLVCKWQVATSLILTDLLQPVNCRTTGTLTQYKSSINGWSQVSFFEFWDEILNAKDQTVYQIEAIKMLHVI